MTHLGPFGTTWYKYRICTCFSCQMGPLGYPKILPWDLIFFFLESGSYMHAFRHMNREGYFWRSKNRKSSCDPAVLVAGPQHIDFWASIHIWKLPWKAEGNQNPMTTPTTYSQIGVRGPPFYICTLNNIETKRTAPKYKCRTMCMLISKATFNCNTVFFPIKINAM